MPIPAPSPAGSTRVTASAGCTPIPWPNGGGITRDLALGRAGVPDPAGPAFDWRLSLADIDRDGPFSRLAAVDRIFAPIEGTVVLRFEDRSVTVDVDAEPLHFQGEAAPGASLPHRTPCRALNLMLARGRATGAMRRRALVDGETLDAAWAGRCPPPMAGEVDVVRACFVLSGRIAVGERCASPGDLLEFDAFGPAPRAIGVAGLLEVTIRRLRAVVSGPIPSIPS
jgi:environmental stress-induced protein Ves